MYAKIRKIQWLLALTAALMAALLAATTAFAEGETMPEAPLAEEPAVVVSVDPPQQEPELEPDVIPAPEEAAADPPVEEAAPEPAPEAETAPAPVEAAPAEASAPEPAVEADISARAEEIAQEPLAEIAAEVDESGVVLVDEIGGILPLTETSSAELLIGGDPYYTVGLNKFSFYAAGGMCVAGTYPYCQDSQGSDVIQDALNYMATSGLPSNRMLYVQAGTYGGFIVNGFGSPTMALLGGVIGVDGSEVTHINSDIIIQFNTGGFTLRGFSVDTGGSIYFGYNSGTLKISDVVVQGSGDDFALKVSEHAGAVSLEGVNVSNNSQSGGLIDTSIGSYPITIKNSAFNHNGWPDTTYPNSGLTVWSNSTITIDGISANANNGNGINVWDYGTLSLKNAFLSTNNSSVNNNGYALWGSTDGTGSAYLENVYAYGNDYGLYLQGGSLNARYLEVINTAEGNGLFFYSTVGSSRVEYGQFHNNNLYGLYIENKGAIYLNSVQSSYNGGAGAFLDNYGLYGGFSGLGSVTITSPATGGWQLANGFFNNGDSGVTIHSRGSVLISNADMNDNGSIGLDVHNSYGLGSVTLNATFPNWQNGFWNNGNEGILIDSQGAVKLSRISAEWNGNTGISVATKGNIEFVNVSSANNSGNGAYLDNHLVLLPRSVIFTNSSFDHNNGYGLYVLSKGSITAYGLSASGNSIRNQNMGIISVGSTKVYHDLLGDSWVEDTYTFTINTPQWVYLYLESEDFDTYLELYNPSGTLIQSADGGWYDDNSYIGRNLTATGTYTVVVKSWANSDSGEYWFMLNNATHINPTSTNFYGAYLVNSYGNGGVAIYKPKDLNRLWGNSFNLNTGNGIEIDSNGTIILDSAAAEDNFYSGVYLYNPTSLASVSVTNSRTDGFYSSFSGNGSNGVYIETRGNVTLKNIGAWVNVGNGVTIDNCQYDYVNNICKGFGGVKVLALADRSNDFGWNEGNGLAIWSKGSILLTNIDAEHNLYDGVWALNNDEGSSGSVVLTTSGTDGWNSFFENGQKGLNVSSNGSIILSKLDAHDNPYNGVYLYNAKSPTSASILITRGYFNYNGTYGLEAYSKGAIIWKYGDAIENRWAGALLDNTYGTTAGVSVQGSSTERMEFANNGWGTIEDNGGLKAYSNGKITLGYAVAENNNGDGFYLTNTYSPTKQMVDITEVEAYQNVWTGLDVLSWGAITVKGIRSEENNIHGAYLFNDFTEAIGAVTVTTTYTWTENSLSKNDDSGLTIISKGNIYLKNINARNNNSQGVRAENINGTGTVTFITTGKLFWLSNNETYGLYIASNGNVTLSNQYGLLAIGNSGAAGIYIENNGTLPSSTVSLTRVCADNNPNGYGIYIYSNGNITAISLTAQNNEEDGAYINSIFGSVALSGSSIFTENGGNGLYVGAKGAISITNARACRNNFMGIYLESAGGNITLNTIHSAHNFGSGLYLQTSGNFTLNKVTAFFNGQLNYGGLWDDGLAIVAGSASKVSILYSCFMNNWLGSGIEIQHPMAGDWFTPFWPTLISTSYLSNGETNLYVHVP